jgi:hypothetical protein
MQLMGIAEFIIGPVETGPVGSTHPTHCLSREEVYTLCSLAADLRVTQTVNGSKGIHCMIAKSVVHG